MTREQWRNAAIGLAIAISLLAGLAGVIVWTAPTRGAIRCYVELIGSANQQDVEAVLRLCTSRYAASHAPTPAPDGGLVGLPRNIHKNFHAWRSGPNVWLCPTNRIGPVYQFVYEREAWRFDGPIGILQPGGIMVPLEDAGAAE